MFLTTFSHRREILGTSTQVSVHDRERVFDDVVPLRVTDPSLVGSGRVLTTVSAEMKEVLKAVFVTSSNDLRRPFWVNNHRLQIVPLRHSVSPQGPSYTILLTLKFDTEQGPRHVQGLKDLLSYILNLFWLTNSFILKDE